MESPEDQDKSVVPPSPSDVRTLLTEPTEIDLKEWTRRMAEEFVVALNKSAAKE